jgi:hypothetical protein
VDRNLERLIEDLYALQVRLREVEKNDEQLRLMDFIAAFLIGNSGIIDRAVKAWAETPEAELAALQREHIELDGSAASHDFRKIATRAPESAPLVLAAARRHQFVQFSDDNLHMLDRVLEFAKYLTDTSDLKLRWHPVTEAMRDPALDSQIEEIRAATSDQERTV